jgi:hypothetical protein
MLAAEFDVLNNLRATASDNPYLRNSDLCLTFKNISQENIVVSK